jgi:predicted MFS family arabinose efflux permease
LSRFLGVPLAAALLRVGQGATVVAMALLAGPAGVVAAFVATYVVHGAANPLHMTLLHRQVDGDYRATVVSLNSMTGQIGLILGGVALTRLANLGGVGTAMIVGAAALAAAAPLYLTRAGAIPGRPAAASANASDAGVTGR